MTNPPAVRAGPGGAVLAEFASSSRHLDLDGLMEAAEAIESGWIEDAFLAQSGSQRTAMWEVRESIPEGEKRRNGSVKHDISVPLSSIQRFLDLAGSQVRSYDAISSCPSMDTLAMAICITTCWCLPTSTG